jgi:putative ABC transport system permease protein
VLASKGQGSFINYNKSVLTPYTSIQTDVLGIKYFQRVAVEAESEEAIPAVIEDVKRVLRDNHDISDPDKDDFTIQTQKDIAQSVGTITGILTVLLASVAAISLIVGGVGIMNIMFVSVTERTREIGLRKALGATNRNILTQFLVEAAVLTISGGIVGIAAGVVLTYGATVAVQRFAEINFPFSFSVNGIILGIVVSTGIGLIFGIFPARHAARKQPVEALRSG